MKLMAATFTLAGLLVAIPAAAADRQVDDTLVPCVSGVPIHATIGAAVAAASPGETILVCAGTYFGNVTVNKTDLTLRAQGIVRLRPGNPSGFGITVAADGVTLEGFDIAGFSQFGNASGVFVGGANRATVRDNRLHGNLLGILVDGGTGHRVRYNVLQSNEFGLYTQFTSGPVDVSNNTVKDNGDGIVVQSCQDGTTIDHNALTGNDHGISVFDACKGAQVTNNTVRGTPGVSSRGILVFQGEGAVVTRNLVQDYQAGVRLVQSAGATASFNSIGSAGIGLDVDDSTGATVTRNNVSRSSTVDCRWDSSGVNVLTNNNCGTQQPAGAFD